MKKIFLITALFLLPPLGLFLFVAQSGAFAQFGISAVGVGYFSGIRGINYCNHTGESCSSGGNYVLPKWPGSSQALPISVGKQNTTVVGDCTSPADMSCADELVNILQGYNDPSGDARKYAGSGFIANAFLGYSSPGTGRTITSAQWTDIRARLHRAQSEGWINWNTTTDPAGTSGYSMWLTKQKLADVSYAAATHATNAIVISGGGSTFIFYRVCANVQGDSTGIPEGSNYSLDPNISASPKAQEPGSPISLTPSVNNSGSTEAPGIQWQITEFRDDSPGALPIKGASNLAPTAYYGHGATVIQSATNQSFNTGVNSFAANPRILGDYPVGARICYTLSVQPRTQADSQWQHSPPDCIVISKRPKVQILGGDLIVGQATPSSIVANPTVKVVGGVSKTFGSWAEYGVVASGTVTGFASGAGYAGGQTNSAVCGVSLLTFTNAGASTCSASTPKGGYSNASVLPDISSRLIASSGLGASPTINIDSMTTGSYSATGNVTINGGTIGAGKWVVINAPTATVTIKGNIIYDPAAVLHTIADIPQVVIIANNINIDGGVSQVDAWLIATGSTGNLNTCSQVTDPTQLNAGVCNQLLTVNGPVVARHLYLYRTAGAGTGAASGDPSEVFNLRPDAYLWATSYSESSGRLQTVTTKELPPRF